MEGQSLVQSVPLSGLLFGVGAAVVVGFWYWSNWKRKVLNPKEWAKFKLVEKTPITTGVAAPVYRFRFALPRSTDILGLPIGQHIYLRAIINEEEITRPYTPTSAKLEKGYFDLVIKVYPKGKMSNFVNTLQIGSTIDVRGPTGRFMYQTNQYKKIGLIAGGTGLTPMLQIINEILSNPDDHTHISFINANVTAQDIIFKEKLDELTRQYPNKFQVYYTLNEPPQGWTQGAGFVSQDMIRLHMPMPSEEKIKILLCGPPPMIKAVKSHLTELGYSQDQVFSF